MSEVKDKAYEEGQKAFGYGSVYTRNPYPKGSEERVAWEKGWEKALQNLVKECAAEESKGGDVK